MIKHRIELNEEEMELELALNIAMPMPETEVPKWLPMVLADAVIEGRDGRTFLNPGADILLSAQNAHGVDVVIDEEHSTELKAPRGDSAPAFGWISDWKVQDNVLFGRVEWNTRGLTALKNKEYRYYSPAYPLTSDGEIRYIKSVGLTNTPNLRLPALNRENSGGNELIPKALIEALGLKADASEAEVVIAVNAVKTKAELNLQKGNLETVPKADFTLALNRAETAESQLTEIKKADFQSRVGAVVDQAVKDGKITPASKDYYLTSCNSEETLTSLTELVKSSPVVVAPNKEETPAGSAGGGSTELNSEEKALTEQLGISTEKAMSYLGKAGTEKKEKGEK